MYVMHYQVQIRRIKYEGTNVDPSLMIGRSSKIIDTPIKQSYDI